ncbi:MAG: VWA domain-containing protein [Planctomycetota bacterium]
MRTVIFRSLLLVVLASMLAGCGGAASSDRSASKGMTGTAANIAVASPASGAETALADSATTNRNAPPQPQPAPQSGQLTAGSWDDSINPGVFTSAASLLVGEGSSDQWASRLTRSEPVILRVLAGDVPMRSAALIITQDQTSFRLTTGTDGRAIILPALDASLDPSQPWRVRVVGHEQQVQTIDKPTGEVTVRMPVDLRGGPEDGLLTQLDLALVIDATGSMGDEMAYVKAEVASIVAAVHARFPDVQQRYALIVYRDRGDEYVTRPFDFTPSLATFRQQLDAQQAGGGGDYPEAMDRGLEAACKLTWRSGRETARMVFVIADAPPHDDQIGATFAAMQTLREQGVAICPVAASGTAMAAEFVMRTMALASGSEYLFLTDDSGIGNSHEEPHIPAYQVTRLDHQMVRVITTELVGERVEPSPAQVIRTVGQISGGVWQRAQR